MVSNLNLSYNEIWSINDFEEKFSRVARTAKAYGIENNFIATSYLNSDLTEKKYIWEHLDILKMIIMFSKYNY